MKAIICTKYGSPAVLQLHEVEQPSPKDDEIKRSINFPSTQVITRRKSSSYPNRIKTI